MRALTATGRRSILGRVISSAVVPLRAALTACVAPESALYCRPDGVVTTCCSGWHVLGRVSGPGRRSLREIWDGAERAALRGALDAGDFELGCFECGRLAAEGRREESLARHFDRYRREAPARYPVMMDFALSNRCNLQCVQCSGSFSSAIRRHREHREPIPASYDDRFFDELDEFLPHLVRAQFKGGEPFLSRENLRVWDRLRALPALPEICVTTNGTVWNDRVARDVAELGFDVIVSVDAVDADVLASIRVGIDPQRLWANIDRFSAATAATGRGLTLSFCLMSLNWAELGRFLSRTDELGAHPDVIWVDGPGAVNLLTMPREELARTEQALTVQDRSLSGLSSRSAAIWDDALGRVRAALSAREGGGVPVTLTLKNRPATEVDLMAAVAAELRERHAGDVLTVSYVDDVITAVEPSTWSDWLRPATWVGTGLDETMMTIAADADATMRSRVESLEGGAHRVELRFDVPGGTRCLHGVHVPDAATPGSSRLVLVEEGLAEGG